jgi:pimeloyl-ACP methyl ester carboxylesterase
MTKQDTPRPAEPPVTPFVSGGEWVGHSSLQEYSVPGRGVRLHAVVAGPEDGPPVVLLHGFPEFWYSWRHQIGPLAAAGFRVVAIDQRGYHRSDKPPAVKDYALDRLADDVVAVLDHMAFRRAAVVGHDWGGIVGWWLAMTRPDRVSRLAVANAPHPVAMRAKVEGSWAQLAKSWYVFAAQVPGLPEAVGRWTDYRFLVQSLTRTARPGTFSPAELAAYRAAWAVPGALTGMVNWYRAAVRHRPAPPSRGRVTVPTLILWGNRDRFLSRDLPDLSAALCSDARVVRFPDATHWLLHEEPAAVAAVLLSFLRAPTPRGRTHESLPPVPHPAGVA